MMRSYQESQDDCGKRQANENLGHGDGNRRGQRPPQNQGCRQVVEPPSWDSLLPDGLIHGSYTCRSQDQTHRQPSRHQDQTTGTR